MIRLLFIAPYVPSPIRVRSYEFVRALVAHGVQPVVLCPASDEDAPAIAELRRWGLTVHAVAVSSADRMRATLRGWAYGLPLQGAYGIPAPLRQRLQQVLATTTFDVVHVEHLRAAALLPWLHDLPVVYDAVDCISLLQARTYGNGSEWRSRALAALELGRTRAFEQHVCSTARITTVTSAEDGDALQALAPHADIRVVPNGVDLERFAPNTGPRSPQVLVFTGKMSYHANIAAARRLVDRIMPLVWQQHPATQLWIVGSDPPRVIQRYAADPRIMVTGRVPQIAPYLQQATVAVSPLCYGVGVQNKVLEALATATPVVIDRQCLAALQLQPGQDVLVADNDRQFAAAVVRLLDDAALCQRLGMASRIYVEQHHRWTQSASTLLSLYQYALQAPPAALQIHLHPSQTVLR